MQAGVEVAYSGTRMAPRPVVLPDYAELELRIPQDARSPAWVCFDGKQRQELHRGDSVRVWLPFRFVSSRFVSFPFPIWWALLGRRMRALLCPCIPRTCPSSAVHAADSCVTPLSSCMHACCCFDCNLG